MARNVVDVALIHSAVTQTAELTPADLRGVRIGLPRAHYWDTLDGDVAKIMDATLDRLRGAGAVLIDVDFDDLIKARLPPAHRCDGRVFATTSLASWPANIPP
jgi:mandelamide amidase